METQRIEEEEDVQELAVDTGMLGAIHGAEIDRQIATAKRYPRSLTKFKKEVLEMACLDEATAEECIYALPRKDKNGKAKNIEGPSARFAEIVVSAWGNARAGARVIAEEKDFVVAQGMFHDLERNVAIQFEVKRRISDKFGRKFSADMVAVTGNAAASIALRNAIFKGVPKAYWAPAFEQARTTALGKAETLASRRSKLIEYFAKMGVSEQQVCAAVGRVGVSDISLDDLGTLKGMATAIKEGDLSVDSAFPEEPAKPGATGASTAANPPRQPDAPPPQQKVEESAGYGSDEPKETAKRTRRGKADAPAEPPAAKAESKPPEPKPEPPKAQAKAEPEPEPPADPVSGDESATAADASTSDIPLEDGTKLLMPWNADEQIGQGEGEVGAILITGKSKNPFLQWTGSAWLPPADGESVFGWVHAMLQRRITKHCQRARMQSAQAYQWAMDTLKLPAPPAKFGALTMDQLVELARTLDTGA